MSVSALCNLSIFFFRSRCGEQFRADEKLVYRIHFCYPSTHHLRYRWAAAHPRAAFARKSLIAMSRQYVTGTGKRRREKLLSQRVVRAGFLYSGLKVSARAPETATGKPRNARSRIDIISNSARGSARAQSKFTTVTHPEKNGGLDGPSISSFAPSLPPCALFTALVYGRP